MEPESLVYGIADLLNGMSKGAYLILAEALNQLGGELRIDPQTFLEAAQRPPTPLDVDDTDGPIIVRFSRPPDSSGPGKVI